MSFACCSLKSDVYFCIYEKDYEQYVKLGTPLEEADIINRFEIRLRNERAYYAVRDLLTYYDAEQTAFSIINQYVRFVDEEPDKRKNDWKLNDRWAWFIGDNRQSLKLTTKPEPYTLDRTLRWVQRQVAPTLKMLKKIDKGNGTDYMETIEQQAKLTEKHEMIIKPGDLIYQDTNGDGNITWDDAIRIDETATPKIIYVTTMSKLAHSKYHHKFVL